MIIKLDSSRQSKFHRVRYPAISDVPQFELLASPEYYVGDSARLAHLPVSVMPLRSPMFMHTHLLSKFFGSLYEIRWLLGMRLSSVFSRVRNGIMVVKSPGISSSNG